jgi:acyl-CoA synthetase (AMP-forming)/AMP-acid ligase II
MFLTQLIRRGAQQAPHQVALMCGDRKTSYEHLHHQVASFANALIESGVNHGDRVAILGLNSDRAIIAFLAAMWAGAIPLFANTRWSEDELVAALVDCEAKALLFDEHFAELSTSLIERCQSIQVPIYIGAPDHPTAVDQMDDLIANACEIEDQCANPMAAAFLNYTGGTTGSPKGVIHTHNQFAAAMLVCKAECFYVPGTTLLVVPLFHISGMICMMTSLFSGESLVIEAGFDPAAVPDTVEKCAINQLFMVPTMLRMTLDTPGFDAAKLDSLTSIRYGGSPIDAKLLTELTELLPNVDFMQVYGQTEGLPITFLHPEDHRLNATDSASMLASAGRPCLGIDIRVADKSGVECPVGEPGEILARGPGMMQGYWGRPELTSQTLNDGWLLTGDIGYIDDRGYVFLVDRSKDMIITGGENVFSAEVERVLLSHELVTACAVIGLPDEKWGEKIHAEIVLSESHKNIEDELNRLCREKIAGYKCPKSYAVVDALPLTAVGKVNKVAIRAHYDAEDSSP